MIFVVCVLTGLLTVVANSFFEWGIHGLLMHKGWGGKYLDQNHHEHDYPQGSYQNTNHGPNVHLPIWAGLPTVGIMSTIGCLISYLTGHWEIVWSVATISFLYFLAYNYFHTCFHVPKNRLFEKTKLYGYLNRAHRIHHTYETEWKKPVNVCLVCPLADWVMGTGFQSKKHNVTATSR